MLWASLVPMTEEDAKGSESVGLGVTAQARRPDQPTDDDQSVAIT